jgi:hypothetical protein
MTTTPECSPNLAPPLKLGPSKGLCLGSVTMLAFVL